jgi:hypothetical protein
MVTEFPKYGFFIKTLYERYIMAGEYSIVDIETGVEITTVKFVNISYTTLCVFGIVHALKHRKETMSNLIVYSYSEEAVNMIKKIEIKFNNQQEARDNKIVTHAQTCLRWLSNNYSGDKTIPLEYVKKAEDTIKKSDLKKWIAKQRELPLQDITTLVNLEKDFKL